MSPRSTSSARGSSFLETWTFKMDSLPHLSGVSTYKKEKGNNMSIIAETTVWSWQGCFDVRIQHSEK
jgi:hypothetical protein